MNEEGIFQFNLVTKIIFGVGSSIRFAGEVHKYGRRPFIVTSNNVLGSSKFIKHIMTNRKLIYKIFSNIESDPTIETVIKAYEIAKKHKFDSVIAIGGGSVIDVGKAVALLATNPLPLQSYEQEGRLKNKPLPLIAIPTTAGSGSEVTKYSVLNDSISSRKFTIKSSLICPKLTIVDPQLTMTCPKTVTASSGIDAMIHAVEAYLNNKSQPITDSLSEKTIALVFNNLPSAIRNPSSVIARTNMSLAALMGGIIINNVRTGMMHTMSVALSVHANIPHGFGNYIFLPIILEYNKRHSRKKILKLADILGINKSVDHVIEQLSSLLRQTSAPRNMSELGITKKHIPIMVKRVLQDQSLIEVNPKSFNKENLNELFLKAL